MSRRHGQTFLQRRHTYGQQTHEKMFIITYHQGNTNQNYNEIISHMSKRLKSTTQETTAVGEDVEEKGDLLHCW